MSRFATKKAHIEDYRLTPDDKLALLTDKEVADILKVSLSYLRKGRCTGALRNSIPPPKHIKVGRSVRYTWAEIFRWHSEVDERNLASETR
jgi:predicted DNA-binding transcriptional regulator AlpA